MTCSIEGCERAINCRGWCRAHYERWRSHGNPLGGGTFEGDPMRLLLRVIAETVEGCYTEWPYSTDNEGRPTIRHNGRVTRAARVVAEIVYGPPPPGHQVAHLPVVCHDPRCLAPLHLRWATQSENERDKVRDGTAGTRAYRASVQQWATR